MNGKYQNDGRSQPLVVSGFGLELRVDAVSFLGVTHPLQDTGGETPPELAAETAALQPAGRVILTRNA